MNDEEIRQWLQSDDKNINTRAYNYFFGNCIDLMLSNSFFYTDRCSHNDAEEWTGELIRKLFKNKNTIEETEGKTLNQVLESYLRIGVHNTLIDKYRQRKKERGNVKSYLESLQNPLQSNETVNPDLITFVLGKDNFSPTSLQFLPDQPAFDYIKKWWLWKQSAPISSSGTVSIIPELNSELSSDSEGKSANSHDAHLFTLVKYHLWQPATNIN